MLGCGAVAGTALWATAQQPGAHARAAFRASLTATLILAGRAADSTGARCRTVAIEWRALAGASGYQVQVKVGASGPWLADGPEAPCGGGRATGPTTFRDRFRYPSPVRYYRTVALAKDGHGLVATQPVPVEVR